MSGTAVRLQRGSMPFARNADALIILALAGAACLQIALALSKSINWDEFFHFSLIHAQARGEGVALFQTPFVYLYGWVIDWPGSNIEHIRIIRVLIAPFELLLAAAIALCAAKFTDRRTALLCALAYMTAGYAFTQGLALRADIIAASLTMSALALGLHRRLDAVTLFAMALLLMLAFVATIKVVLFFPVFIALAIFKRGELGRAVWIVPIGLAVAIAVLPVALPEVYANLIAKLHSSATRMFGGGLMPQGQYWLRQITLAPAFSILTLGLAGWLVSAKVDRDHKWIIALLAAPVLWPIIYFNSYPYFFAFILPPVAVAIAPIIAIMVQRYGSILLAAIFLLNAAALFIAEPRAPIAVQTELQDQVRATFDEPVEYIDESGMIADFPRAVPHFASGWALANYRAEGQPTYSARLMNGEVPLLITNSHALGNIFSARPTGDRLLAEDEALLRANYVRHNGMVYVAGKRFEAQSAPRSELVAIPGQYRIEGAPLIIDGKTQTIGSTINLARKEYVFANPSPDFAILRWAGAGSPGSSDMTLQDLFTDY